MENLKVHVHSIDITIDLRYLIEGDYGGFVLAIDATFHRNNSI